MKRTLRTAAVLVVAAALLLAGCMPWQRIVKGETTGPDGAFSVVLPVGWVRNTVDSDRVALTRDGPALQRIEIVRHPHDKAFPKLEQASRPGMLASEVAELQVAELRARPGYKALEVVENGPASVDGRDGFRIVVAHANARGLNYLTTVVGFVDSQGLCTLTYSAPRLYFHARDAGTFASVVASFRTHVN